MNHKRKLLGIAVLLLLFAAVKTAAVLWWQNGQDGVVEADCADIRQGCALPDGSVISFDESLGLKTPFDIELRGSAAQKVSVSFSMKDMDMGFNRHDLQLHNGVWQARQVRLPVCVFERHDFLLDVNADGKVYRLPFRAE
ncbi:MAG: hypothetical protein Q4A49_04545 [Neisseria sp.]|nr:hypothetical protein [Neisseria sp.]